MVPFDAKEAFDIAAEMGVHQGLSFRSAPDSLGPLAYRSVRVEWVVEKLSRVLSFARKAHLPTSPSLIESQIREAQEWQHEFLGSRFGQMVMEINRRLADELGQRLLLMVETEHRTLFDAAEGFGPMV